MENVYYWTGLVSFWLSFSIGAGFIFWRGVNTLLNLWGKFYKFPWRMLEYIYYCKEFDEWVKDKERHKRLKD